MKSCNEPHMHMEVHGAGCVWIVLTLSCLGAAFLGAVVIDAIGRLLG